MARHWDSAFCCPDARINEDHRALFKLLDRIATHRRKTDREDLEGLLQQLLERSLHHFAHEEGLMRVARHAGAKAHQEQHRHLSNAIRDALGQVSRGLMIGAVDIDRLKEAYTFHFKRDDMPFITSPQADFAMKSGTGQAGAVAFNEGAPPDQGHESWRVATP